MSRDYSLDMNTGFTVNPVISWFTDAVVLTVL